MYRVDCSDLWQRDVSKFIAAQLLKSCSFDQACAMHQILLLVCCVPAWGRVSNIAATGNPHAPAASCSAESAGDCECPAQRLDLSQANLPLLPVQPDSFLGILIFA